MRDRIVDVCVKGVSRHNVIDLVMRHGTRAQIVETREDRQDENEDDQQFSIVRAGHQEKTALSANHRGLIFGRENSKVHTGSV